MVKTIDTSALTTTAVSLAGISTSSAAAAAIEARAEIMQQTQAAETAVLRPSDPGRWPPALRAALAARIANLNQESALAEHYRADAVDFAQLADPASNAESLDGMNTQKLPLTAVIAFMDKVAGRTNEVEASDISALQMAGVADDDIVRLCELNAFLAYQLRLAVGFRLLAGENA